MSSLKDGCLERLKRGLGHLINTNESLLTTLSLLDYHIWGSVGTCPYSFLLFAFLGDTFFPDTNMPYFIITSQVSGFLQLLLWVY